MDTWRQEEMTLNELAKKMSEVIRFRYATASLSGGINFWTGHRPKFNELERWWDCNFSVTSLVCETWTPYVDLDLSEYKDADGNIDFSRAIVEVK